MTSDTDTDADVSAVSLWEGPDDPRTRIDAFRFTQPNGGRDRVRISNKTWADAGLPADVEGWPITVTDDGAHTNTSVVQHDQMAACHKLSLAPTGPRVITP